MAASGENVFSPRQCCSFDSGWRFFLGNTDSLKVINSGYNDSAWRLLDLPHDWAIEGNFDIHNPSGTGGGALPGGLGWYRKTFRPDASQQGKRFFLRFDGVYMNSEVFLNGHSLGIRPNGYVSFEYDLTPYLRFGKDNVITVRVDNSRQPNSRWYSGCGIYRHVWITTTSPVHVALWGSHITTTALDVRQAILKVQTTLKNENKYQGKVQLSTEIKDRKGQVVASSQSETEMNGESEKVIDQTLTLKNPNLWNLQNPYLYTVSTQVKQQGKTVDEYESRTGLRTFRFDARKGFFLNGTPVKINGVCLHHDLGCLGSAVNKSAIERQLRILKEMGCNGIRCSHNPPAPELLDLCDSMGFIVMDEAFDMWHRRKSTYDYANYFDRWYEKDLTSLVVRDRNHPSVFMWNIGNEVLEQWSDANADTLDLQQANLILNFGHDAQTLANGKEMSVNSLLCRKLASIVKALDPDRPVTAACNEPDPKNHLFRSQALDIIGYNYHNSWFDSVPKNFPDKPFIVTESVSALMTRGYYYQPSDLIQQWPERWDKPFHNDTFSCSSFDQCHVPWGNTHEETWDKVKNSDFISGQYIWTGFDYIGEPTPFGWPARSSYFGIVDLAGFPKDVYYMYQSEWTDKDVLHVFPHWNWKSGETVDVWAYYNHADEVELFLNGKSQGIRSKKDHEYHVMWRLAYQPGELKVVSRRNGKVVKEQIIRTAGEPSRIRLTADRSVLKASASDLAFVTVEILDKDGNLCPLADNQIEFYTDNLLKVKGVDNGSPISLERFKASSRKAFNGKCLVVLQNTKGKTGAGILTAKSKGLQNCSISLKIK